MDVPSDSSARRFPFPYRILALIATLALFFGGGWSSLHPSGLDSSGPGRAKLELAGLGRELAPAQMAAKSPRESARVAERLVETARLAGIDPREALGAALPEPGRILGMLALDRDIDDFSEHAARLDAAGAYYRDEARIALEMRPLRSRYEAAFAAAWMALSGSEARGEDAGPGGRDRKRPYIAAADDVWLPARSELPLSHPFALDVFFQDVVRSGETERGPVIRAIYPGIVVSAAGDWSGGAGIAKWSSGGLSPASGNGVVIYDPASRRYCSYFHLCSLGLRVGDVVAAGAAIGRGGNSGMNARIRGHGEHVHLEIFDAARDEALPSAEILELLKR